MRYCTKCGNETNEENKFCGQCGESLNYEKVIASHPNSDIEFFH
ncbi:zinc-ribbon domain-containing protein [Bacillus cereus]|nr:zinc-ribbon domain-containing protein [Bacillus cereus]USL13115.1 zinc-ribbon domain-containing protein [Bacillus thuringiensis]